MRDLQELINQIIPKNDIHLRDGFSNDSIIDHLDSTERDMVENELISRLNNGDDFWVAGTFGWLLCLMSRYFSNS